MQSLAGNCLACQRCDGHSTNWRSQRRQGHRCAAWHQGPIKQRLIHAQCLVVHEQDIVFVSGAHMPATMHADKACTLCVSAVDHSPCARRRPGKPSSSLWARHTGGPAQTRRRGTNALLPDQCSRPGSVLSGRAWSLPRRDCGMPHREASATAAVATAATHKQITRFMFAQLV